VPRLRSLCPLHGDPGPGADDAVDREAVAILELLHRLVRRAIERAVGASGREKSARNQAVLDGADRAPP